ncbi:MAG: ABC transporter permease subunit [Candidatus Tectomicrobia bacterium]|nr:ABC transporter permease subunit [Candidatus Tectomicrobia bacterium]
MKKRSTGWTLLAVLAVVVVWTACSFIFPVYLFPSIPTTMKKLLEYVDKGELWGDVGATSFRVFTGWLAAIFFGTITGVLLRYGESFFKVPVFFLQTIPALVWSFFAVIWFGLTQFSVIFVVFIVGYPLTAINVWMGLKSTDLSLMQMAQAYSVSRRRVFFGILIPTILPFLLSSARSSLSYGWRMSVLAELIVGGSGIGYKMLYSWENFDNVGVFAWTLMLIVMMLATEYIVIVPVETYLMRWRPK